jgi:L-aspartate oxidase
VLAERLAALRRVDVRDHAVVVQAIVEDGVVAGVRFLDADGTLCEARASATLLATGGAGQIYRETTNPTVASGDGVALAYLAGARVADLEFVQFHPTVLAVPGAPRYLLSEALRGEGARLINDAGEPFMPRYEADGDLAARDRVSRAIVRESARTGRPVYLSMAHLPAGLVHDRFPAIAGLCRQVGLDLARDRLPVSPAAHYLMGGVATDLDGRTSLPGLFAAGEVAATGVHGANRLASNSLLEGLVFGGRAGRSMSSTPRGDWPTVTTAGSTGPLPQGPAVLLPITEDELREVMWQSAGVFRDREGLAGASERLQPAWEALETAMTTGRGVSAQSWRSASLLTVSRLIVRAALRREESRGAHSRTDFPAADDTRWRRRMYEERSSG